MATGSRSARHRGAAGCRRLGFSAPTGDQSRDQIHDRHSVTHALNDGKVVADEEIAEAEFGLQFHIRLITWA